MPRSSSQAGFTLIELIIVIVILGILSVTAAPRFIDFQDAAQASTVQGTGAAFASAIKLAHLKWASTGNSGPVDNLDLYGNGNNLMDMNANGWPAQSYLPFEANPTLDNDSDCISVWGAVLGDGSPTVASDTSQDYQATYSANTCTYLLVAEPNFSIFYDSNTGEVTIDSTL